MQRIPDTVLDVLRLLTDAGHEAWCVGGCVRDLLLGNMPGDWDVTTSALPEETLRLFGKRAIPTGLQHGTVTVVSGDERVEVTTYRTDGSYADHRHPEQVTFTRSLTEDLARRDFTVNAMAMAADGAVFDPMGGRADLEAGVLRCVGEPDRRFDEDALRILRGLRFTSVLGFAIEPKTEAAIRKNCGLLREIAAERVRVELEKLLCGKAVGAVLRWYPDVLGVILPEILPAVGFDQRSKYHCYDVWEHTVHGVENVIADPVLRLVMLLHDLGKPSCFTVDEAGNGHFYGHPFVSRDMAEDILKRLRFDNARKEQILLLVERHDWPVQATDKAVGRALRLLGEKGLRDLLRVKRADNLAQATEYRGRQLEIDAVEAVLDRLLAEQSCFSLKQLAVNGRDMMELGLRGSEIGIELERLLTAVIDGELPNEQAVLLKNAKENHGESAVSGG